MPVHFSKGFIITTTNYFTYKMQFEAYLGLDLQKKSTHENSDT